MMTLEEFSRLVEKIGFTAYALLDVTYKNQMIPCNSAKANKETSRGKERKRSQCTLL